MRPHPNPYLRIPIIDLDKKTFRQVVVDREDGQYPGIELLPDETFAVTTYGHWEKDKQPYVLSGRFKMKELDDKLKKNK